MTLRLVSAALLTFALTGCIGDLPGFAALTAAANLSEGTDSTDAGEATTTAEETTTTTATTATGEPDGTDTGGASGGEASSTTASDAELVQPQILAVDMPAKVHLAGPVAVKVTTADASLVRARLDGLELEEFEDQGDGVFAGVVPIFGAVDNGDHVLEVIAVHETLADLRPVSFSVAAPAAGGLAWGLVHPTGSTGRRVALTVEGDMIEVGALDVEGVPRPSIRKRAAANGSEMWPEGTLVLDEREGSVDAVAVLPDGRMWVAMNVKDANKKWRPRIILLDANGHETGVEAPTEPGATLRGIAADDAGGFFAVGFAGSGSGDMDIVVWRMRGDHVAAFSAKPWDYVPDGQDLKHTFSDFAFDVVVRDGVAWVVGASEGKHNKVSTATRGIIVPMHLDTGAPLEPVIVALSTNTWPESMFLGAGHHPEGVIVTGNEVTGDGSMQRITVQAYRSDGELTYYKGEFDGSVAYGTAVAWSAHGVAVATGVVQDGDALRGILFGRGGVGSAFDHLFPPSSEPSSANGLALDVYDQAFIVGDVTSSGLRQARAARVHQ